MRTAKRFGSAAVEPGEALETGKVHPCRKGCAHCDQNDPEQPLANAHLIPRVTPGGERQWQGRPGRRSLLGIETGDPGLPCTVSVPNLNSDRPIGMTAPLGWLNMRRLMYQTLIWTAVASDEAGGMGATLHAKDLEGSADALIDGMWRNSELGRDFFGGQVLIDEAQAIQLTLTQPRNALLDILRVSATADRPFGHPSSPSSIAHTGRDVARLR